MAARDRLQTLLNELGARSGAAFRLEDNGVCRIRIDGDKDVVVEAHDNMGLVFMHATVLPLAGIANRAHAYEAALSMALFGAGTGGCALGYDQAGDQLVLSVSRPVDRLDPTDFVNLFGNFVETATRLGPALAEAAKGDGAAPAAAQVRPQDFSMYRA